MQPLKASLLLGFVLLAGCATGSTSARRVTSEFTPEDALLFEDGVDYIGTPMGLDGKWLEDWRSELVGRSEKADVVAVVSLRIVEIETYRGSHERTSYLLIATPQTVLHGETQGEMELPVREGSTGFAGVKASLSRLRSEKFVAYVKWYLDDVGGTKAHWHLSPATRDVVAATERQIARHHEPEGQARVYVHQHED